MINEGLFTSKTDNWATPQAFFDKLNDKYNFTLDVCADMSNRKCELYYSISDNGLEQDWSNNVVWCNPPYGKYIKFWIEKAANEAENETKIVMLLPARTDTRYFHDFIYNNPRAKIEFIKGRLKFGDSKNSAPFPSMIVIFN